MEGFLEIRLPPALRRLITRAIAIVPALKLSDAISYLLIGGLTLVALLAYSSGGGVFKRRRARSIA